MRREAQLVLFAGLVLAGGCGVPNGGSAGRGSGPVATGKADEGADTGTTQTPPDGGASSTLSCVEHGADGTELGNLTVEDLGPAADVDPDLAIQLNNLTYVGIELHRYRFSGTYRALDVNDVPGDSKDVDADFVGRLYTPGGYVKALGDANDFQMDWEGAMAGDLTVKVAEDLYGSAHFDCDGTLPTESDVTPATVEHPQTAFVCNTTTPLAGEENKYGQWLGAARSTSSSRTSTLPPT